MHSYDDDLRSPRLAWETLEQIAAEMAAGNVDADPYWRSSEINACRWCDYRAACHFEECCGDVRRRRKGLSSAEFWQAISGEKEVETDGN